MSQLEKLKSRLIKIKTELSEYLSANCSYALNEKDEYEILLLKPEHRKHVEELLERGKHFSKRIGEFATNNKYWNDPDEMMQKRQANAARRFGIAGTPRT